MVNVTLATYCHAPHLAKLHAPGVLKELVDSHAYHFSEVIVVHQRCKGITFRQISEVPHRVIFTEDYPDILASFGINPNNKEADYYTHGPTASHFWVWHVLNHLCAAIECTTPYIVFSDCDCLIIQSGAWSWIEEGLKRLQGDPVIWMISPNDGSDGRLTQNVSQQLFMVERERFLRVDFDLPWNGKFDAPGGPMQEYYFMLEGRIGRYLTANGLYRHVLPMPWRYWHYNPWEPKGWKEGQ